MLLPIFLPLPLSADLPVLGLRDFNLSTSSINFNESSIFNTSLVFVTDSISSDITIGNVFRFPIL